MDIAMPLLNGLEATRQIRQAAPATKVLVGGAVLDTRPLMVYSMNRDEPVKGNITAKVVAFIV